MSRDRGTAPEDDRAGVSAALFDKLTVRQRLVSVWMTAGFSGEEIARHLGITQQVLSAEVAEILHVVRGTRP